jgi:hypothetical protein
MNWFEIIKENKLVNQTVSYTKDKGADPEQEDDGPCKKKLIEVCRAVHDYFLNLETENFAHKYQHSAEEEIKEIENLPEEICCKILEEIQKLLAKTPYAESRGQIIRNTYLPLGVSGHIGISAEITRTSFHFKILYIPNGPFEQVVEDIWDFSISLIVFPYADDEWEYFEPYMNIFENWFRRDLQRLEEMGEFVVSRRGFRRQERQQWIDSYLNELKAGDFSNHVDLVQELTMGGSDINIAIVKLIYEDLVEILK